MSRRSEEKEKTEQFLGSRRSELGGGEEHAGRGPKPGRRLWRHEGRYPLPLSFPSVSYFFLWFLTDKSDGEGKFLKSILNQSLEKMPLYPNIH